MAEAPKHTVTGSCHCKNISYKVSIPKPSPDTPPSVTRCNCTVCQKPGFISLRVSPDDFELISPASKAELPQYSYRSKDVRRYFCDKCGVQVYGEGQYEFQGQKYDFFSVNLNTIDQPQEGIDLSDYKFSYINGLEDKWMDGTKETPYPGGTV